MACCWCFCCYFVASLQSLSNVVGSCCCTFVAVAAAAVVAAAVVRPG